MLSIATLRRYPPRLIAVVLTICLAGCSEDSPSAPKTPAVQDGRAVFVDVTASSGIDFRHENGKSDGCRYPEIMGAGVGLFDYDGDGDLDIYFVNGNRLGDDASAAVTNRLYRNDGAWKFVDVTATSGVGDAGFGQGCCVGDYDGDGDLDLYVSNFGVNRLYRNRGDGAFEEVAADAGVADPDWGQSCAFLDYDGDGRLDLWVQNYLTWDPAKQTDVWVWVGDEKVVDYPSPLGYRGQADRLYRNVGNGKFQDVTEAAGVVRPNGKGMGLACADFDDDGHVDVFVSNDTAENYLFRGRPGGRFEETGLPDGVAFNGAGVPEASMGADVGDCDGDGRLDLIVPCLHRQVFTLYRNKGELFVDASSEAGLAVATSKATGFNANFIDFDSDGDLDIFFTAGGVRRDEFAAAGAGYDERYGIADVLVENDGRGHFTDVSSQAGPYFGRELIGRGSAVGDLDLDGDLDLVVCNLASRAVLLRNDTAGGHWISIELIGESGALWPFGAEARVTAGGRTQRSVLHPGVTYLSQSDRRLFFGLSAAKTIDRLEIIWPGGRRDVHTNVAVDRFVRVTPGGGVAEVLHDRGLPRRKVMGSPAASAVARGPGVKPTRDAAASGTTRPRTPPSLAVRQYAETRFQAGYQHLRNERYSRALTEFQRAAEIDPTDPRPHHGQGEVYQKLFLASRAEEAYRAAIAADPSFLASQKELSKLLHDAGRHREVVDLLEPLVKQQSAAEQLASPDDKPPKRDSFWIGELAINLLALGDTKRAIELLQKYNDDEGRQAWGYSHLGRAWSVAGNVVEAEAAYLEALDIDPNLGIAHYWYGQLLVANGRDPEAKPHLERYRRLRSLQDIEHQLRMTLLRQEGHVPTMVRLAETIFRQGRKAEAARVLDKARKLAPEDEKLQTLHRNIAREAEAAAGRQ